MKKKVIFLILFSGLLLGLSSAGRCEDTHWGTCKGSDNDCMTECPACGNLVFAEGRTGVATITRCPYCGFSQE